MGTSYECGQKVMLDREWAFLYGVLTKRLNEQVKRNIDRFPKDFMFQLTSEELENWKSQFATSNQVKMVLRKSPMAFSEQGVAMLSSVLNSKKAIHVNIQKQANLKPDYLGVVGNQLYQMA